jgi:hypothetical protein
MTRNHTLHFEITTTSGEIFTEQSRNSLGGHFNMMRRIAARFGVDRVTPVDESGRNWNAGSTTFTMAEVNKL